MTASVAADNHKPLGTVQMRPRLRGVLHTIAVPIVACAGLALVAAAPTLQARVGAAVYVASAALLFAVSAMYHRGQWSPTKLMTMRRLDHSNIFVMIAGTYTPMALLALSGTTRVTILAVAWAGALMGVAFGVLWPAAPRWITTALYIALGWVAVIVLPQLWHGAGAAAVVLTAIGGLFYTFGGVVYALKKPNPSPRVFGFHEVCHACTLVAFACQFVAVLIITQSVSAA